MPIRTRLFAMALAIGTFLVVHNETTASAQNAMQDFQKKVQDSLPKGRFLKRLRDEIRGSESENEKPDSKQPNQATSGNRSGLDNRSESRTSQTDPLPAAQPRGFSAAQPNFRQPVPSGRNGVVGTGLHSDAGESPGNQALISDARQTLPLEQPLPLEQRNSRSLPKDQPVGFGLSLDVKDKNVVVTDVDRKGNANTAGIKKGDVLESIGGFPISSIEEFDQVADIMKNGDQIEMEISRRGKKETVNVTFGYVNPDTINEMPVANQDAPLADKFVPQAQSVESSDGFAPPLVGSDDSRSDDFSPFVDDRRELHSVLSPAPPTNQPSVNSDKNFNDVNVLRSIIEQQQDQIDSLRREVERLRNGSSRRATSSPILGT